MTHIITGEDARWEETASTQLSVLEDGTSVDVDGYAAKQDPAVIVKKLPIWPGLKSLVDAIAKPVDPNAGFGKNPPYSPR